MRQVWYASYGSNLDEQRFGCYLRGGTPPGSTRRHPPCPAGPDWLDTRPVALHHRLRFGRESPSWGGAVAFVDRIADPAVTSYGRGWLLTVDQWRHVVSQENAGAGIDVDDAVLLGGGIVGARWYDEAIPVGDLDGVPVLTLTGTATPPGEPSPAYLDTIRRGLRQCWPALTEGEVAAYLAAAMPTGRAG